MKYLSRDEVRSIDRRAIKEFGLPGIALMENAGRSAAEELHTFTPHRHAAIFCGKGNNGGDGYVIARHLELLGWRVHVLSAVPLEDLSGDAAINANVARRAGIPIDCLSGADVPAWCSRVGTATVLIDALLGTGASGPPRDGIATAIEALNASRRAQEGRMVCAIDLPSGLDCDTGLAAGMCVQADLTVTFVAPKQGFQEPAAIRVLGHLAVVGIGAPACVLAAAGVGGCTGAGRHATKYPQQV